MNKEYKISELMENYSDNEFFLEGEQTVDTEKAVSELLAQVKPKKRMKPMFKALAAAAAAAAVFAGATTASSIIGNGHFTTVLNARFEYASWDKHEGGDIYSHSNQFSYQTTDFIYPAEERDGRLIFTADGQNTDITDLIDRRTPYIYSYTIPQTGFPAHIIVGGDPDDPAFVEIICFEGFGWYGYGGFLNDETSVISDISVTIRQYGEDSGLQFSGSSMNNMRGWYLSDTSELIYYHRREDTNGDGEIQENEVFRHDHKSADSIPLTWEKDCPDAWLISAFLQLELFELPDFSLIDPVAQTADGRVILVAGGRNTDITDLLSESKPYVYAAEKSDNNKDSYILIGGTPEDLGWALVCRSNDNVWVAAERNVIGGGLREWFVNGAEQIGYDLESLLYTLGVVR